MRDLAIVRSANLPAALTDLRATPNGDSPDADDDGRATENPTMTVRFSVFGAWYEIDSFFEGRFLERTAPGSFKKTIGERASHVKVLFNHGHDTSVGDKILGRVSLLQEREEGPYGEVELLDTSYNRDLIPGLRAGVYGSSFMFNVIQDEWNMEPERSEFNPDGVPERTIKEVRLLEFGPVTWPASPSATAGLRSHTDHLIDGIRSRSPERFERLAEQFTDFRAEHGLVLRTPEPVAAPVGTSDDGAAASAEEPHDALRGLSPGERASILRGLALETEGVI